MKVNIKFGKCVVKNLSAIEFTVTKDVITYDGDDSTSRRCIIAHMLPDAFKGSVLKSTIFASITEDLINARIDSILEEIYHLRTDEVTGDIRDMVKCINIHNDLTYDVDYYAESGPKYYA